MSLRGAFPADRVSGIQALILGLALFLSVSFPAYALSEIQPAAPPSEEVPIDEENLEDEPPATQPEMENGLPAPQPLIRKDDASQDSRAPAGEETKASEPPAPIPDIITDPASLPEAVARMRELIMEAAASGDPERLRSLLGTGPTATQLALHEIDSDPVAYLKSISGDAGGQEILAIMLDVLDSGFVRVDEGLGSAGTEELYVWPYFAAMPIEQLTPAQQVGLLRIVTAGDFADMLAYGSYNFYRIAITSDGQWRYFLVSD